MQHTGPISLLIVLFLVTACSGTIQAPVGNRGGTAIPAYHIVQKGEGLYYISWQYGLDYMDLAKWNDIDPPYFIHPGQKIYLREQIRKKRPIYKKSTAKAVPRSRAEPKKSTSSKAARLPYVKEPNVAVRTWIWPAKGKVIRHFSTRDNGKKGIAIAGHPGDPIIASAGGKVVYSGNGLVRYGQLVIIKHNNEFLSAYAHNRKLLVREGEKVKQGQKIAEMGKTGTTEVILHFEIRKFGKPVNPLRYLK